MTAGKERLHVAFTIVGTMGDVMPFLAIGDRLAARGHTVEIVVNDYFRRAVARHAGLSFRSIGTEAAFHDFVSGPAWAGGEAGWPDFLRIGIMPTLEPLRAAVTNLKASGRPTVIVANNYAYGARAAAASLGMPLVNAYIQPAMFLAYAPPTPGESGFGRAMRAAEDYVMRVFAHHGGGAAEPMMARGDTAGQRFLGLWPTWFKAPESYWPARTMLSGFPMIEIDIPQAKSRDLEAFLAAGPPPVALFYGSFRHDTAFYEKAFAACRSLGERVIVICRYPDRLPATVRDGALVLERAPFQTLFPRLKALVHHGGIGTIAQAVAAGIPQVTLPLIFEQPANAADMAALGVGTVLPLDSRVEAVAASLDHVCTSAEVGAACRRYASRMADDNPWEDALDIIEAAARA